MTGAMITGLSVVLAAIIGGGFGYLGLKVTKRADARASAASADLEARKVDLDEFVEFKESLQQRVASVEADLKHEKDQRRLSNGYARTLANVLRAEGISVPQPPAGLDIDL